MKEIPPKKITWTVQGQPTAREFLEYHNPEIDNLRDYFQVLEKQKITHLLLDGINNTPLINDELRLHLIDIFNHENKYPFLVKEYDSRENGFNYHVKLFKINYDLYDNR